MNWVPLSPPFKSPLNPKRLADHQNSLHFFLCCSHFSVTLSLFVHFMADPGNDAVLPSHLFPDDFPYDLDSDSESGEQDEDEFLAQLTRRLTQKLAVPSLSSHGKHQKNCMAASSPQSTLSGLGSCCASGDGSPSQFPSPPTTPFCGEIDTWNLIYAAAGQVARLKMSNESPKFLKNHPGNRLFQTHPLVNRPSSCFSVEQSSVHNNLAETNKPCHHQHVRGEQRLSTGNWQIQIREKSCAGENVRSRGPPCWAAIPAQPQNRPAQTGARALILAGSGAAVKRESAGTGVFLPRRSPEFRKKPAAVVMPAKVEQAHLNFHEINQANYSSNPGSSYDGLMTGRNAAVTRINRSYRAEGTRLPNEWTY